MMDFNFKRILTPSPAPEGGTVQITGALLDEVKRLSPGQVLKLKGRDDELIAILRWEDLEHILINAGMRPAKAE